MKKKLKCVLLVDDNESDNFLHSRVLEKSGVTDRIEIVINGKEALEFLTSRESAGQSGGTYVQPELILLDINMPVMDAWDFLEEYQNLEDEQKGKIVIVMLTTSFNPNDKIKAEKLLGHSRFQYKPLTLAMIQEIMQNHFPEFL